MPDYTLVHIENVENKASSGTFKMLKKDLEAKQVTLSIRSFPPHSGQRGGGGHKHEQIEEVFYVLRGELIVKLDDEEVSVKQGDAMRIAPEVMRAYQNDSDEEAIIVLASPVLANQRSDGIHDENFWK